MYEHENKRDIHERSSSAARQVVLPPIFEGVHYKILGENIVDAYASIDNRNTNFKKKNDKKKGVCHVCGDPDHWAPSFPNHYDKRHLEKGSKTTNVVIGDMDMKDVGPQRLPPC